MTGASERDDEGLAWLTFDKAETSTNTLSVSAMEQLRGILGELARDPPRGLVIRSGKAKGFIAGADIDEFGDLKSVEEATALVKRGWDTFDLIATASYPTLALVRGFCLGGGMELALACRYRVVVDEPGTRLGLPEVMLGIVPGWGGIKRLPRLTGAPAALDLLLSGKSVDAPPRNEARHRRRMRSSSGDGERRARRSARIAASASPAFCVGAHLASLAAPDHREPGAQASGYTRHDANTILRPYAILDIWVDHDGDALARTGD